MLLILYNIFFRLQAKNQGQDQEKCKKSAKTVKIVSKMKGYLVLSNFFKIRKARLRISLSEKRSVLFMGFAT
ncbi:hypothetical protein FSBG_01653 [Fusobacterium gonidiaformans 3-1-5R]|uniref:Uncharacterized protein n=1 Tax=Fusobacterium gonidiaformans 3-1-5R TaxID=469605 RepID=E5BI33_9FUSO|nr:hypothetical protein FSBG_01653 [Fusobacterium gonidiaformans 3-1-5R]